MDCSILRTKTQVIDNKLVVAIFIYLIRFALIVVNFLLEYKINALRLFLRVQRLADCLRISPVVI